jgi:hypothetical protein
LDEDRFAARANVPITVNSPIAPTAISLARICLNNAVK